MSFIAALCILSLVYDLKDIEISSNFSLLPGGSQVQSIVYYPACDDHAEYCNFI